MTSPARATSDVPDQHRADEQRYDTSERPIEHRGSAAAGDAMPDPADLACRSSPRDGNLSIIRVEVATASAEKPGGELGGSGPLVVFAEVGEDGHDPVPDPGSLGGADQDSQHGLAVLAAADASEEHVIGTQVRRCVMAGHGGVHYLSRFVSALRGRPVRIPNVARHARHSSSRPASQTGVKRPPASSTSASGAGIPSGWRRIQWASRSS